MAKETETPIVDRLAVIVAWKHENFHFWDSKTWSKVFFFLHLNLRYYRLARLKVVYEDTCPKSWNCYDENLIDSIRQHQLDFTTFQHHHWELVQLSFHFLDSHLGFNMSNHISICSWCSSRHKQEGGWRELEWIHPWRSLVSSTKKELLLVQWYVGCITFHLETGLDFIRSICCTSVYIIEQDFHFHEFVLNHGTELTKQNTRKARLRTVSTQVEILTAALTSY